MQIYGAAQSIRLLHWWCPRQAFNLTQLTIYYWVGKPSNSKFCNPFCNFIMRRRHPAKKAVKFLNLLVVKIRHKI